MNVEIYIGLGSNLNDPTRQIASAVLSLQEVPGLWLIDCSSLYLSRPMGPSDQPAYVNAVARFLTGLSAQEVLKIMQSIEFHHGRRRDGQHWGPRTLDLDLLLYGNRRIDQKKLTVPHPGIRYREFVLYPLYELNQDLIVPGTGLVSQLIQKCYANGIQRMT